MQDTKLGYVVLHDVVKALPREVVVVSDHSNKSHAQSLIAFNQTKVRRCEKFAGRLTRCGCQAAFMLQHSSCCRYCRCLLTDLQRMLTVQSLELTLCWCIAFQTEAALFCEVLLACDMLASNCLLSVAMSEAIVAEIMGFHNGSQGSEESFHRTVRTSVLGT